MTGRVTSRGDAPERVFCTGARAVRGGICTGVRAAVDCFAPSPGANFWGLG